MPRFDLPLDEFETDDLDYPEFQAPPRRASRPASTRSSSSRATGSSRRATTNKSSGARSRPTTSRPASRSRLPVDDFDAAFEEPSVPSTQVPAIRKTTRKGTAPPRRQTAAPDSGQRILRAPHPGILGLVLTVFGLWLAYCAIQHEIDGFVPRYLLSGLRYILGVGTTLFAVALAAWGLMLLTKRQKAPLKFFWGATATAFALFLTARHLGVPRGGEFLSAQVLKSNGGYAGAILAFVLRRALGEIGAMLFLITAGLVALWAFARHGYGELVEQWQESLKQLGEDVRSDVSQKVADKREERQMRRLERQAQQNAYDEEYEADEYDAEPVAPIKSLPAPKKSNGRSHSPFLPVENFLSAPVAEADQAVEERDWEAPEAESIWDVPAPASLGKAKIPLPQTPFGPAPETADDLEVQVENPFEKALQARRQRAEEKIKTRDYIRAESPSVDPDSTLDAPQFVAPKVELVNGPKPVELPQPAPKIDIEAVITGANAEQELTPVEALEAQAEASAREDAKKLIVSSHPELPRRRFKDGPLMPEYFDEAFNALDPPIPVDNTGAEEEIQKSVVGIQDALGAFKIDARVTDVKRGPVITRYEVQPGPGVRVASIANLDKDLARSLSALAVRIEAPVPGKNVVGIEIPNKKVHLVRMRDVLGQEDFLAHPSKLAFALGKDIAGQPKWADLTKMPHMLIAGSTNSGKSVCLNSIIASILVRARPDEVRFSLIDPKRVELTLYRGIRHLMHDVVVEPKQAVIALRRSIEEMDRRYKLFATRGVRNIASYNAKLQEGEKPMPYIVIVIDELADLMMTAAAEFEKLICRLAQLARATGIHLIVATQRPSVNVITGVIKANIPARIAFAVASQVDSRTILDQVGAERLIGSGDMLFDASNGGKATRIQGAFLSEEEVNRIVEVVKATYMYEDPEWDALPQFDLYTPDDDDTDFEGSQPGNDEKRDALYDDIVEFISRHEEMSASLIQRKFGIGYPRAGRIVDQLERAGVLGPADGPKPRKVLRAPISEE